MRGDQPTEKKYGDLPIKLDIFYHEILIQLMQFAILRR